MRRIVLVAVVLALGCGEKEPPPAPGQADGEVVALVGQASARRAAGEARELAVRAPVWADDTVQVAAGATLRVLLRHNDVTWSLEGGEAGVSRKVSESVAWRAPRGSGGSATLAQSEIDRTGSAGRHTENEAAGTAATATKGEATAPKTEAAAPPEPPPPPPPVAAAPAAMPDTAPGAMALPPPPVAEGPPIEPTRRPKPHSRSTLEPPAPAVAAAPTPPAAALAPEPVPPPSPPPPPPPLAQAAPPPEPGLEPADEEREASKKAPMKAMKAKEPGKVAGIFGSKNSDDPLADVLGAESGGGSGGLGIRGSNLAGKGSGGAAPSAPPAPSVTLTVDDAALRKALAPHTAEIKACVASAHARGPVGAGILELVIGFDAQGRVILARAGGDNADALRPCVEGRAKMWSAAALAGKTVKATYRVTP